MVKKKNTLLSSQIITELRQAGCQATHRASLGAAREVPVDLHAELHAGEAGMFLFVLSTGSLFCIFSMFPNK